jgi:hypothetical protein
MHKTVKFSVVMRSLPEMHSKNVLFCMGLILGTSHEGKERMFENKVLGKLFGPKADEVKGDWRKLQKENLHDLYSQYY